VSIRPGSSSIPTDELLKEHQTHSNKSPPPTSTSEAIKPGLNLKLDTVHARRSLKAWVSLNTDFAIEGSLSADLAPFLENTRVVGGKSSKFTEHDECFIVATFTSEPARRIRQEYDANAENETGYHLEEKWKPPGPFTNHESGAVSRPEGDHDTEDDTELLKYEEGTTDLWRRDLGDIERSNCS
jgi:hypothetical protein